MEPADGYRGVLDTSQEYFGWLGNIVAEDFHQLREGFDEDLRQAIREPRV